jgi:hypothetical protein
MFSNQDAVMQDAKKHLHFAQSPCDDTASSVCSGAPLSTPKQAASYPQAMESESWETDDRTTPDMAQLSAAAHLGSDVCAEPEHPCLSAEARLDYCSSSPGDSVTAPVGSDFVTATGSLSHQQASGCSTPSATITSCAAVHLSVSGYNTEDPTTGGCVAEVSEPFTGSEVSGPQLCGTPARSSVGAKVVTLAHHPLCMTYTAHDGVVSATMNVF